MSGPVPVAQACGSFCAMLAHGWMSIVTWIFGCDALNCATSAW
jgi:hypothetical protein